MLVVAWVRGESSNLYSPQTRTQTAPSLAIVFGQPNSPKRIVIKSLLVVAWVRGESSKILKHNPQ